MWVSASSLLSSPSLATTVTPTITILILSVLHSNKALQLVDALETREEVSARVFQPALIGFRCENANEVTRDGIVVIEANAPVRVTLFGESFTTDTIVGFTAEFVGDQTDALDKVIEANNRDTQVDSSESQLGAPPPPQPPPTTTIQPALRLSSLDFEASTVSTLTTVPAMADSSSGSNNISSKHPRLSSSDNAERRRRRHARSAPQPRRQSEADLRARRHRRRLLDRQSYDCTDYDRVKSYKLTEENIITPNVAVLTINLPELDSGSYYYFCLKQPQQFQQQPSDSLQLSSQYELTTGASGSDAAPEKTLVSLTAQAPPSKRHLYNNGSSGTTTTRHHQQEQQMFWAHQGDEWWLMIKVEPPILSIANDCVLIVLLLFLSAVTSGLNLGLMSLDMNELAVISSCGDQRERSYARAIAPLRKRGNFLLCSLLLGNVMVNSTLTVILEEMTSGVIAVIGSTLAIVVLGEIVPQAFCARQGLAIGARTIYLTYAFMLITFPLSYPISCLLDCVLGEEKGNVYDRERLMEFIRITGNHTQLEADEVAIISGALKLKKIKVDQIMTRIEDVFMLPIDCMLDRQTIRSIIEKGYSRIPIYESNDRKQIVALILAKDLALLDPDDQMPLANMLMYCKHPLIFIEDTATLDVALNEFKTGKSHMAIVRQIYDDGEVDKYYEAIGVVTLEDVIEEVLQTEINDETDTLSDNRRKRRRTDAQVAHLVDELITTCSPKTAAAVAPSLKAIVDSTQLQLQLQQQQDKSQQQQLP